VDLYIVALPQWDKKDVIFKNEPEKLLKTKGKTASIAKSEPENEAEKLLKTGSCGKNEPENEPGHVIENTGGRKKGRRLLCRVSVKNLH